MRCERCQEKGYAYCFHFPHATPLVHIVGVRRMVETTEYYITGAEQ